MSAVVAPALPATERAYRNGFAAAVAGRDCEANPFGSDHMRAAWAAGWRAAVAETLPLGEDVAAPGECGDCRQPRLRCRCQGGE